MLVYRDRTFCDFYKDCACGYNCNRALTDQVKKGAKKIGLPISLYANKPDCFEEKVNKK